MGKRKAELRVTAEDNKQSTSIEDVLTDEDKEQLDEAHKKAKKEKKDQSSEGD